jgi:hypothetical protein
MLIIMLIKTLVQVAIRPLQPAHDTHTSCYTIHTQARPSAKQQA